MGVGQMGQEKWTGGRRWTEREWDRWDKRNALGKLKMNTKFQLETLKVTGILGDLSLDEM